MTLGSLGRVPFEEIAAIVGRSPRPQASPGTTTDSAVTAVAMTALSGAAQARAHSPATSLVVTLRRL